MEYEFECRHVVEGCPGTVRGESFDEVLTMAAEHAAEAHGFTDLSPEVMETVHANITAVDEQL